jgi:predicted nucleic acid-binding Zn ribbon protein
VGDVLARLMRDVRPGPRRRRSGVQDAWSRVAGTELADEARPATLRKGVLTVEVRSAALLHELEGFRKDELLARLLEEDASGRVTGLKFRLGVF